MEYNKTVKLKNGKDCLLRSCSAQDGAEVLSVFNQTHVETDNLLSYPDENTLTTEQESAFLKEKQESKNEVFVAAVVDGKIAGTAGNTAVGSRYKVKHRAEFGIGILKDYWGLGIGSALTDACIACAREAGYSQLELTVVADNTNAIALYKKKGFIEYGRNPKGFLSRTAGYQELIYMRLEL